jgi:hypothetical protein
MALDLWGVVTGEEKPPKTSDAARVGEDLCPEETKSVCSHFVKLVDVLQRLSATAGGQRP